MCFHRVRSPVPSRSKQRRRDRFVCVNLNHKQKNTTLEYWFVTMRVRGAHKRRAGGQRTIRHRRTHTVERFRARRRRDGFLCVNLNHKHKSTNLEYWFVAMGVRGAHKRRAGGQTTGRHRRTHTVERSKPHKPEMRKNGHEKLMAALFGQRHFTSSPCLLGPCKTMAQFAQLSSPIFGVNSLFQVSYRETAQEILIILSQ